MQITTTADARIREFEQLAEDADSAAVAEQFRAGSVVIARWLEAQEAARDE